MKQDSENIIQILERVPDPRLLEQYFSFASKYRKKEDKSKDQLIKELETQLFAPNSSLEQKKIAIVKLAGLDDVKANSILKKYNQNPDPELKDWLTIAIQENAKIIESSLLEKPSIIISTGLGGKENKLRYFAILVKKDRKPFLQWQKELIEKELKFTLEKFNAEVENIKFQDYFVTFLPLIPYNVSLVKVLDKVLHNINEIGDFLVDDIIILSEKIPDKAEIEKEIDKLFKPNRIRFDKTFPDLPKLINKLQNIIAKIKKIENLDDDKIVNELDDEEMLIALEILKKMLKQDEQDPEFSDYDFEEFDSELDSLDDIENLDNFDDFDEWDDLDNLEDLDYLDDFDLDQNDDFFQNFNNFDNNSNNQDESDDSENQNNKDNEQNN